MEETYRMEETYVPRRRRRRRRRRLGCAPVLLLCLAAAVITGVCLHISPLKEKLDHVHSWQGHTDTLPDTEFGRTVTAFAASHSLTGQDWPEELLELGEKNSEMEEFILNYPLKKDDRPRIDLSDLKDSPTVPLLMQWDERWGYSEYSGGLLGLSGCGPTCLSMVSIYLLNDPGYDPRTVAEFSMDNGYSVKGNGSAWTLISEGGPQLGLDVIEIPLDRDRIFRNLEVGNPIICIMGPGDFTSTGHYIVLTGVEDGKLRVNDPNSRERSEQLWDYDAIQSQIRNLWVCR